MNDQSWFAANDRHLEASLTWLRLRLERLAPPPVTEMPEHVEVEPATPVTVVATPLPPAPKRSWWRAREAEEVLALGGPAIVTPPPRRAAGRATATDSTADVPGVRDLDSEVTAAHDAMVAAEESMPLPPALVELAEVFELGEFARHLLLLAAGPELDPRIGRTLLDLHGQPWPTFALAAEALEGADWESRSPGGPLRRWHLVEADQAGGAGLSICPLRVDERVLDALKGLHQLDTRLAGIVVEVAPPQGELPASQRDMVERAAQLADTARDESPLTVVQLVGPSSVSRRLIARHVARLLGGDLFRLQARLLPTGAEDLEQVARLWHREVLLARRVLLLDEEDGDASAPEAAAFLARTGGVVLVAGAQVARELPGTPGVVDVAHPSTEEQMVLWHEALTRQAEGDGGEAGVDPEGIEQVVEQFDLDAESIAAIALHARAGAAPVTTERLWDAARRQRRPRLESVAQRVRPVATWDDLVLPEQQRTQLTQVASQVRHRHRVHRDWGFADRMNRGLGVSALFAGESGTGKSMTAEVLARELDLDLYRIDLSAVVSKYIGETEKNLRHLFDSAEGGGVILFFDEADALFGKRSEVKDAHDRYANIETNYLLQRMEQYGGLAILATNMRSALDRAFTRRLRFVVEFPFPDDGARALMWERAFPEGVPLDELDVPRLAHIDLTGAGIASAALAAAFTAAAADRPVSMGDVLGAAREELRKLQRPVVESQFRVEPLRRGRAS